MLSELDSGNPWGLTYGWAAAFFLIGAALYGIRRRMLNYDIGRSHTWVQFHVYGGVLFLLLVFMHSGFRLPSGTLTWWVWLLSIWITLSGIAGVALQKWIPKMLSSGLAIEVVYERIPELVNQISESAERLLESCTEPVQVFYEKNLAAALMTPQPRLIYYLDITGGIQSRIRQFQYLRRFLSSEEKDTLDRLESMYKTKLELDAHYTLQKALRWWLYMHVPVSLILLVLVALHLYAVTYY